MWKLQVRLIHVVDEVEWEASASAAISIGKVCVPSRDIRGFLDAAVQASADALRTLITREYER